jgi:hypothetical protein
VHAVLHGGAGQVDDRRRPRGAAVAHGLDVDVPVPAVQHAVAVRVEVLEEEQVLVSQLRVEEHEVVPLDEVGDDVAAAAAPRRRRGSSRRVVVAATADQDVAAAVAAKAVVAPLALSGCRSRRRRR